jgi:acetyl esterase/lipase
VVTPTITVYKPKAGTANKGSVIVCPGGGFSLLAIEHEGTQIAEWLTELGLTAFLLKYRVHPTPSDKSEYDQELARLLVEVFSDIDKWVSTLDAQREIAVADGLQALKLIRSRAEEFGVDPSKIGMIGFSAGASLTIGAILSDPHNRPDFAASIYGGDRTDIVVDANAPPIFLVVSQDDPFRLAADNIRLYQRWIANGAKADLHIFSEGGHGYGIRQLGLTSDQWPILFERWLKKLGVLAAT